MLPVEKLRAFSIFSRIPDVSLERLARDMSENRVPSGEVIVREGDNPDSLYLIAEGCVRIDKKLGLGDRVKTLARLGKEEFFGEMSLFDRQPAYATVIAVEPTLLYVMKRDCLEKIDPTDSRAALDHLLVLFSGLSAKLRTSIQELIAVFEISRILIQESDIKKAMSLVLAQVESSVGEDLNLAFYVWNQFNEEYDIVEKNSSVGLKEFPISVLPNQVPQFVSHDLLCHEIMNLQRKEGLMLAQSKKGYFSSAEQQLFDTVAAMLGPALENYRLREEELSKKRLEQQRTQPY